MKIIISLILVGLFITSCFGFDDQRFLAAIAVVETNNDNSAIGKAGERSKYQFMEATWNQYSNIPHARASEFPEEIERVANVHLNWIKSTLKKNKFGITVENCAAIWNAGWGNFKKGYRPKLYIQKVKNSY